MQACQREYEEKKIRYQAFLLGNICFDSSISAPHAHQLVRASERLSFQQLCLLRIFGFGANRSLRDADYRNQDSFDKSLYQTLSDCLDLDTRGYINGSGSATLGLTDIHPSKAKVQGIGADLCNQMGLITIPQSDWGPVADVLSDPIR